MQSAVAVPVGVLAAISVAMFIFMFWWFPRHYQKGVKMDMAEHDAARREMEAGVAAPPPVYTPGGYKAPPRGYVAPVTPY